MLKKWSYILFIHTLFISTFCKLSTFGLFYSLNKMFNFQSVIHNLKPTGVAMVTASIVFTVITTHAAMTTTDIT